MVSSPLGTHIVTNQALPLENYNLYGSDQALQAAVVREGGGFAEPRLLALGARLGEPEVQRWAEEANRYTPVLRTHDRYGHRIDEVDFHPSWHELMALSVAAGVHASPWRDPRPGAQVARTAAFMLIAENELGHGCPLSMTYSVVPALRAQPELSAVWEPRVTSLVYDPRSLPADQKRRAIMGMAMTEKQGGSDVRANTTRAEPLAQPGPGQPYRITGHKWFCSAPQCDAFLILAQAPGGLSCFLLPRFLPDGTRNAMYIQRLKDKLGNRSNASSEVEYVGATAWMVGGEGRGVPTILEMANHTRLDCAIGSTALMRAALAAALHHCAHREAFGRRLAGWPLMQAVLADLALESEAATALTFRLARTYDGGGEAEEALRRILTPVAKYYLCKRVVPVVHEAMECLGGVGYVEEFPLARLYREAPLYGIWEGSGNVICLDVLRVFQRHPDALDVVLELIRPAAAPGSGLARLVEALPGEVAAALAEPGLARRMVERLAVGLQAALLSAHAPEAVAQGFLATRVEGDSGRCFGALPAGVQTRQILERAAPA